MHKRIIALFGFLSVIILSALMQVVSPAEVNPMVIVAVFALIYVLITSILFFGFIALRKLFRLGAKKTTPVDTDRDGMAIIYCGIVALAPVTLLAMTSIGEISPYNYILVTLLVMVFIFYVRRQSRDV